ncbi:MAG: hypothetical protein ACHQIO_14720 [Nevskiales bacterium]
MLRLRFLPGLIVGFLIGIAAGTVIGFMVLPPQAAEQHSTSAQVQDLSRRLEAAQADRERADRQLEQFQKLADQMTASFNSLETRFKLLEEEQRVQAAAPPAAAPTRASQAAAPQAVAPPTPTAPAAAAGAAVPAAPAAEAAAAAMEQPDAPAQADPPDAGSPDAPVDPDTQ